MEFVRTTCVSSACLLACRNPHGTCCWIHSGDASKGVSCSNGSLDVCMCQLYYVISYRQRVVPTSGLYTWSPAGTTISAKLLRMTTDYVLKRMALSLLSSLLGQHRFMKVSYRYATTEAYLKLVMNLLRDYHMLRAIAMHA